MARVVKEVFYGEYGVYGKEVVFSNDTSKLYIHVKRGKHSNPCLVLANTASAEEIQTAIVKSTELIGKSQPDIRSWTATHWGGSMPYSNDGERLQDLLFAALAEKVK